MNDRSRGLSHPMWLVALSILCAVATAGMSAGNRETGWDAGLANDFNGSADLLEQARDTSPGDPIIEFSYAAALLSRQPLAQDNVRQALDICLRLGAEAADPDLRLRARFLSARIQHAHLAPVQLGAAAET